MKRNGPRRTPTPTLIKQGSHRGISRDATEPRLTDRTMIAPEWLNANARQYFDQLVDQLQAADIDKAHFTLSLAGLAHWLDKFVTASKELETSDDVLTSPTTGGSYINPQFNVCAAAWKQVSALAVEFGMTASSISKIAGDMRGSGLDDIEQWQLECTQREIEHKNKTAARIQ